MYDEYENSFKTRDWIFGLGLFDLGVALALAIGSWLVYSGIAGWSQFYWRLLECFGAALLVVLLVTVATLRACKD